MRKNLFLLFVAVWAIGSCKRNNSKEESPSAPNGILTERIQSWFEKQQQTNKPHAKKIAYLKENLQLDLARLERYGGKQLVLVPIKTGFETVNNKGKNPVNYLLLFLDGDEAISGGRIVQYVNAGESRQIPENAIGRMLKNEDPGCNGTFTFLNILDKFLYEFRYAAGKKTDFSYMKPKGDKENGLSEKSSRMCHDWYLITTHYNQDGSVEVFEEYLGRTCDGCTLLNPGGTGTLCDVIEDETGGGTANECCMLTSNATFTSNSVSEQTGDECGPETIEPSTGIITKTCIYTWIYNTSEFLWNSWQYKSTEVAILEKQGLTWKYRSLNHSGKSVEGATPTCMTFTDEITSAQPSLAADRTSATMSITYWIKGQFTCVPLATPMVKNYSSYSTWNAH